MKPLIPILAGGIALLTSCGPSAFDVALQVRQPSRSGLDLSGKTMSVVYLSNDDQATETQSFSQASRLSYLLESNYFDGKEAVGMYKLDRNPKGDYSQRDTLIRMVVGTGDDVVFLVDEPESAASSSYNVYVLDSMSGSDEVKRFAGASSIGEEFVPDWKVAQFEILYFDSSSQWNKASQLAFENRWAEAMQVWMDIAGSSKNPVRRAAACYDTSIACFLLGDKALALKWLDRADASYKLESSPSLRRLFNTLK